MRIGYLCHNFATFILNEIIEIEKQGHVVFILGENTSRVYEIINKPILVTHGLDKQFYGFSVVGSRRQKYTKFFKNLFWDLLVHPICAIKGCYYLFTSYTHPKLGIVDYLDIRKFFGSGITLLHSPFSVPSIIDKVYLLSKILNVPYTLSFKAHDIWQGDNLTESKKKETKIKEASRIFTIANFNKTYLQSQLDLDTDIQVIHDAIDVEFFRPAEVQRTPNSIIAVSRLSQEKGLIYLIRACHILKQRQIDCQCTIIGEGPEKSKYEKLIEELEVSQIYFTGFLPQEEVQARLQVSAVFVLPSIVDSDGLGDVLPNSVKEAMAMQVPVITSNIRGIDELVTNGVHGIVVPPGSPEALADAIEQMIGQPAMAKKMGQVGRIKIKTDFNLTTEVGKIENVFKEAVAHA